MSRLWRIPSTIAEYTLGTLIVMYQLAVRRRLHDGTRQRKRS